MVAVATLLIALVQPAKVAPFAGGNGAYVRKSAVPSAVARRAKAEGDFFRMD
jgi:hypothetical protein